MEKITEIDPIELMITNSDSYKEFVINNPNIKDKVDYIIKNYIKWKKYKLCGSNKRDFCYHNNKNMPYSDSWSVDEPADYGTPSYLICKTWKRFENQMGTTQDKFELSYDYNNNYNYNVHGNYNYSYDNIETLKLIGEMFSKIGYNVFVATFTHWRIGYGFNFQKLEDINGKIEIPTKDNDMHSVHICISRYMKK